MKRSISHLLAGACAAAVLVGPALEAQANDTQAGWRGAGLVRTVRMATAAFRDVNEATGQGYGVFLGCVSSPHEGAMGVHYVNGALVGDGMLDATQPEALVYEPRGAGLRLVGVEYVVLAEAWHASNELPPVLEGQVFNYVGSPNRYGLPAFYELHVWAWKVNPSGTFADHNPRVSCEAYTPAE